MGSTRTRLLLLVTVVAMVAAACGDSGVPATIDLGAPSTEAPVSDAPAATQPAATEGTTAPATADSSRQRPDGPAAPDFALEILGGPGGTFVLSEETKPVFMVFWAEW